MHMTPRLTEPVQQELKKHLQQVTLEIEKLLYQINDRDCSILNELEQVHNRFKELHKIAGSHYLNAYLSPFTDAYQALTKAIQNFSEKKHGALIVVERENQLEPLLNAGILIDASVSTPLLESVFYPGNPLHDGAVLIKANKIASAGNVLPLSKQDMKERKLGTRHRAAIGLSERSDALVLVVSEETGRASFALEGKLYPIQPGGLI